MDDKYLLSICMMVKDEEKNLGRCLEGLGQLLDKKDVELIIVDTGSSDQTLSIAKKYTERVYCHGWNNNFSEMRNISISYARGTYILILDADEVLLEPLLLYEYLNDIQLRIYNTFLVKIKNLDSSGSFTVIAQERVFRNDGDFRYEGTVHNQPMYKKPIVNTEIYIEHYGYLFNDKELREKKFVRTAGILRKELEKNPDNPYYRFQLARSLSAHLDAKEALEEIRRAYGLISGNPEAMKLYVYIYGTYSIICIENKEFEEAVTICREGLGLRSEYIDLYYIMAVAYVKLEKKDKAQEAYERYLDLATRYNSLAISGDRAIEMYYTGHNFMDSAIDFIVNELFSRRKYNEALKFIEQIHEDKVRVVQKSKAMLKLHKFDELKDIFENNKKHKIIADSIIRLIEAERTDLRTEDRKHIETVFSTDDDIYSLLNKVRISEGSERIQLAGNATKQADFNELPDYYSDILLNIIDINTRQAISVFKQISKIKIKQYVKRMLENRKELEGFFENYLTGERIRCDDCQSLRVFVSIAYALLFNKAVEWRNTKRAPSDLYYNIFRLYIENGIKYTSLLYGQERLRLYYSTLEDQEDKFFIALRYSVESVDKNDYKTGIKYFREAARANPYLACYMNEFRKDLFHSQANTDLEEENNE